MTGIWAMAQGPSGFLWPMFSSMPWSLPPASLCARHLWKTLMQQHHLVAWLHSCHLQQGKFSKTKQNYSKREILFSIVLRYSSVFCLDFSTGDQPDASVSPEGSSSGLQAQQQQQQQQRVSIHKPFTQSRVPPDLPMHPAPRNITDEELRVLEGCLHRWRSEVENDTRGTNKHARKHVLILISCCFGLYKCTCFCLICGRSAGQYIQNPQNHRAYVFWQVHDAGKKLFEISDSFLSHLRNDPRMSSSCTWCCVLGAVPAACRFGPRGSGKRRSLLGVHLRPTSPTVDEIQWHFSDKVVLGGAGARLVRWISQCQRILPHVYWW